MTDSNLRSLMVKTSFEELKKEAKEFLDNNPILVLATSGDGRVTARSMLCVHQGLTVLFETDINTTKLKQMRANPNVALCAKRVQIEGTATIRAHPLDPSCRDFAELYKSKNPRSFNNHAHHKNQIVVEVEPHLFTFWRSVNDYRYTDVLYLKENRYEQVQFDTSPE